MAEQEDLGNELPAAEPDHETLEKIQESKLLTTNRGRLVDDIFENAIRTSVPGLSSGIYRLVTLVTIHIPIKATGYHDGPMIQVI